MHVTLDKHGGRNRYAGLIQHHFPEHWIDTLQESREVSRYRTAWRGGPLGLEFRKGGEQVLPTALASMTAKYLRELSMQALNRFWAEQTPGIRPTAGYPVDAKRFKSEIAETQARLGVADRMLWRNR